MSLQLIIDTATAIQIERSPVVAQTVSRNQKILTAVRNSTVPWRFTVSPSPGLPIYYRRELEDLYTNDRWNPQTIQIHNGISYLVDYEGDSTPADIEAGLTITSYTGNTFTLTVSGNVAAMSSGAVIFRPGDIIQPANSRYPYAVSNTVTRGSGSTIQVQVNRGIMADVNITGSHLKVGADCVWTVLVTNLPVRGVDTKRTFTFSGNFELTEAIL